jgi:hypothetical protein
MAMGSKSDHQLWYMGSIHSGKWKNQLNVVLKALTLGKKFSNAITPREILKVIRILVLEQVLVAGILQCHQQLKL